MSRRRVFGIVCIAPADGAPCRSGRVGRVREDGISVTAASRSGELPSRPVLDPVLDAIAAILGAGFCVLDAEERLLAWNDTYLKLFPEEADLLRPGLPCEATVRRFFETHLEPAERPFIDRHVAAALERHRNPPSTYTRQCKDGRWLSLEVRRLPDGRLLKLFTDVTSRHDGGAMKEAITAVDVGLIRYAGDGTFQTANRAASVLFPALVGQFRSGSTRADHIRLLAESVLAPGRRRGPSGCWPCPSRTRPCTNRRCCATATGAGCSSRNGARTMAAC